MGQSQVTICDGVTQEDGNNDALDTPPCVISEVDGGGALDLSEKEDARPEDEMSYVLDILQSGQTLELFDVTEDGDLISEPPMKKPRDDPPSGDSNIPPLGAPCEKDKCKKHCTFNIAYERRRAILQAYWSASTNERKAWVFSSITKAPTKKHQPPERTSGRKLTYSYHLKDEHGQPHEVCKVFFISTLGYHQKNDRFITTAVQSESLDAVLSSKDRRGRHSPANKLDCGPIKNHIESFGPSISHYRRQHAPNRRYLANDITVKFMHEDFIDKNPSKKCSYETYRKVVRECNISFTKLGEEECERCVQVELHTKAVGHEGVFQAYKEWAENALDVADDDGFTNCSECKGWLKHKKAAATARRHYKEDSGKIWPDDWSVRSADLQKVMMLPRLPRNKTAVFTRRLVVYHETFAPLGSQTNQRKKMPTLSVVWHEGIAGRSAEEVTSAFVTALQHHTERDVKHAIIWADNCTAQNKNWALLTALVTMVNSSESELDEVNLKFFEPGHTFMSADSVHHGVERAIKRCPGGKLFDFDDFVSAVSQAGNNTEILRLQNKNVLAWKGAQSQQQLKLHPKLAEMVEIQARRGSKDLFYKTSHDDDEHARLPFLKKNLKRKELKIPSCLREHDKGVPHAKKADIIQKLLPLMPENRRKFWRELAENDEDVEE